MKKLWKQAEHILLNFFRERQHFRDNLKLFTQQKTLLQNFTKIMSFPNLKIDFKRVLAQQAKQAVPFKVKIFCQPKLSSSAWSDHIFFLLLLNNC